MVCMCRVSLSGVIVCDYIEFVEYFFFIFKLVIDCEECN